VGESIFEGAPAMLGSLVERVFESHFLRKLYHLLGGGLGIIALLLLEPKWFLLVGALYVLAFFIYGRRISFAAIGVILVLLLSGSKFITLLTTVIWVIGDGLAGFLGAAYGKRKWPWHEHKTIVGSVSFFAGSSLAMLALLFASTGLPPLTLLLLSTLPCLVASMVEILPVSFIKDRKVDDNLIVILATGLVLRVLTAWLGVKAGF
jgi:dolichol kinase